MHQAEGDLRRQQRQQDPERRACDVVGAKRLDKFSHPPGRPGWVSGKQAHHVFIYTKDEVPCGMLYTEEYCFVTDILIHQPPVVG